MAPGPARSEAKNNVKAGFDRPRAVAVGRTAVGVAGRAVEEPVA